MQMLDGFNQGWISFEGETQKGRVELKTALAALITKANRP